MWNSVLFLSGIVSACFVLLSVMLMAYNSKLNNALKWRLHSHIKYSVKFHIAVDMACPLKGLAMWTVDMTCPLKGLAMWTVGSSVGCRK
jgi:hypothetical protein